jgi:hypothetical protein
VVRQLGNFGLRWYLTTPGSKLQSDDAHWKKHNVEKNHAAQHSKPKHKVSISPVLGVLPHVLKNPIHVDEHDRDGSRMTPQKMPTHPRERAKQYARAMKGIHQSPYQ